MNIEEYPYFEYPKGLDLHSEYVITPIEDFKNENNTLNYLVKKYLTADLFEYNMNKIISTFTVSIANADYNLYTNIIPRITQEDKKELFDYYYMRKYGMTRDEAIYWKNYNEDDKLFEKKQIMKCDADTYFTFTVATGQDMHGRIIFIHNIASMVANAVVGGVLYRLVKEDPDKNTHIRSSLKSYIDCVKEMYDIEWLPSVAHAIHENL